MTTTARRVRATPVRTPTDAWAVIVDLLAAADDGMRRHLMQAGNPAAMVISEEHTKAHAMIVSGCGPQVRIYTLHGAHAIEGTGANEQRLAISPSDGWQLALPAPGTDFDLVASAVEGIAHVTVYDPAKSEPTSASESAVEAVGPIGIDLSVLEE